MTKHILLVLITGVFFLPAPLLPASELRTAAASFSGLSPELDGEIERDPAWSGIPWSRELFYLHRRKQPPLNATRFKTLYTGDALYFAVECREQDISKLKRIYNFGEFWNYDNLEFFLQPKEKELMQLVGNYEGMKQNIVARDVARRTGYKTSWLCAAKLGGDRWYLEICVPFYLLGVVPDRGDVSMPFNLCRNSVSASERSTWSFQSGSFNNVKDFGRLVLRKAPENRRSALQQALSRPHWSALEERWLAIRNDPAWKPVFDRNPREYAELMRYDRKRMRDSDYAARFYGNLSRLETYSGKLRTEKRERILKRLFEETGHEAQGGMP